MFGAVGSMMEDYSVYDQLHETTELRKFLKISFSQDGSNYMLSLPYYFFCNGLLGSKIISFWLVGAMSVVMYNE